MKSLNELSPPLKWEDNPVSIKYYVKRFILKHQRQFENKVVIDTPAGSGITSQILKDAGATVHAFDLFPEYFKVPGLVCRQANIMEGLPVPDDFADILFCQEGLEHLSDQYRVLNEFSRVIKKGGSLFITTPNYSNLQSRLSYFLFETEYLCKKMPANEVDSVWMTSGSLEKEIYLGHFFLLGIQKLRGLAKLSGFRIKRIIFTKINKTSLFLFPFAYPLLWLTAWWTFRNNVRRSRRKPSTPERIHREQVYQELVKLNTNVRVLLDKNLFVELEKEADLKTVRSSLRGQHKDFDVLT